MESCDLLSFNVKGAFEGEKFQSALSWLPEEEHKLVMRFKFQRDQHLALASLLIRRHYFSNLLQLSWDELKFDRLPGGKPCLKGQSEFDYNTSHEGDWVIFGNSNKIKIGIDAVCTDQVGNNISIDAFINSFQAQLTKEETKLIFNNEDENIRKQTFFEIWGCKESYIKAIGTGLSLDLSKLNFYNYNNQIKMDFEGKRMDDWSFQMDSLDQNTLAVICYGCNTIKVDLNTRLLGDPTPIVPSNPQRIHFYRVRYEDLQMNKWKPQV